METLLYILLALFAFGVMVLLHEAGHFLTAHLFGVATPEFSVGMGPKLCGFTGKDGTAYSLRALPIGGYVSMKGEDEDTEGADSFSEKRPWQRFLIVAAGAAMNILLALVLMFFTVLSSTPASTEVTFFADGSTSAETLSVGDRILRVDGRRVHNGYELSYAILHDGYRPMEMEVLRDGKRVTLPSVTFPTAEEQGMLYGLMDFYVAPLEKTAGNLLSQTWYRSLTSVRMIWESLFDLLRGRVGMEAVSGPVGVTAAIGSAAKTGANDLLFLLSLLSMNLGVFNLLPLPALDGGRLVFLLTEIFFRKKVPARFEAAVHFAGIVLLFAFMLLVTGKDILTLIG